MIKSIDIGNVRAQSATPQSGFGARDFGAIMSNVGPTAAATTEWNMGGQSGSITHAAITGMAGGANALSTQSSYSYPGGVGGGSYYGGNVYGGGNFGPTGAYGATGAGPTGVGPTGANMDPIMVTQAIRDMNMEMISIQSAVTNEARVFTTMSNIEKARYDMAKNAIQNIRVT